MSSESNAFTIKEAAVGIHETFLSLVAAGFTKTQALQLVGQMFRPQPTDPS